jgi:two-component system LytT family response regulator
MSELNRVMKQQEPIPQRPSLAAVPKPQPSRSARCCTSCRCEEGSRIVLHSGPRTFFVSPRQVEWVEGAGNYCRVHLVDGKSLLVRELLSSLEQRLGTESFLRIHRSAIIRLSSVVEVRRVQSRCRVVLIDGTEIALHPSRRSQLEERLQS